MNKDETLEAIQKARVSHETQMAKIKSVINGDDVKDPTAVLKTECEFGKWLYDDNNQVQKILGSQFYNNIETLHSKWHREYIKIFEIFFKNKKKGFLSKIMGTPKVDEMALDKAKLYHSELLETTNELLRALDTSQRRVQALGDSKFT